MARLREQKIKIRTLLSSPDWKANLDAVAVDGMTSVGPLMGMLQELPALRLRAAIALGMTTAVVREKHLEQARDVWRRLMWRMSEESGNIGWGIPEAMSELLISVPGFAKDYHALLFTQLIDLGRDDNYCDNEMLRRSSYFAIGRFVAAVPDYAVQARNLFIRGLRDTDSICRAIACWALGQMKPTLTEAPLINRIAAENCTDKCVLTDGDTEGTFTVSDIAKASLAGHPPYPWKPCR